MMNILSYEVSTNRGQSQVEHVRVRSESGDWIRVTVTVTVSVGVGVGVAELATCGGGLQTLTTAADLALYDAKATGRNTVRVAHRGAPGDRAILPLTNEPSLTQTIPVQEPHDSQRTIR